MKIDPRTPIIVGAGVQSQRYENAVEGKEAYQLMAAAVKKAAADAGSDKLLTDADLIAVPKGLWSYEDAGQLVAQAIDNEKAQTLLADIGVLQQTLFNLACTKIQNGQSDIVIVTGGETKYRTLRAQIEGIDLEDTVQEPTTPTTVLKPDAELWSQLEWDNGLGMPVTFYSVMENALRHAQGLDIDTHRDHIAELWLAYNQVAQSNVDAWNRKPVTFKQIRDASEINRMLAFPYTKLHNSQWSVDQAAAGLGCERGGDDRAGA